MSYKLIVASAHDTGLPSKSVHCIVTSSPYYSLRAYSGNQAIEWPEVSYAPMVGMPEITIKGCDPGCVHEWNSYVVPPKHGDNGIDGSTLGGGKATQAQAQRQPTQGAYCIQCGGWRGGLGSESTIESFIGHLILVLREMHRVLRDDGICFFNLGDSYSGSGGYWPHSPSNQNGSIQGKANARGERNKQGRSSCGLPAKNLMMVPARFALAAQADGWIVRSAMPWLKRNQMPDSCTDRPGGVVESIFLMTKNERYFWDAVAVEQPGQLSTSERDKYKRTGNTKENRDGYINHLDPANGEFRDCKGKRNFRSSDLFFKTWEGMLLDDCGDPLAMVINPKGFSGSHFACFPPELPEMAILAGTSEAGVCPHCGKQWRRCVETVEVPKDRMSGPYWSNGDSPRPDGYKPTGLNNDHYKQGKTTGWAPSCSCPAHTPIPATVLDPFVGSGTTCMVAQWLGRDSIGLDLSDEYHQLAHARINTPREKVEDKRAPADGQMGLFEKIEL